MSSTYIFCSDVRFWKQCSSMDVTRGLSEISLKTGMKVNVSFCFGEFWIKLFIVYLEITKMPKHVR